MERVIFVEVLGRRGEVLERVRLERLPATIGRAWGCDVIVSDPLVDAQHARLVADEQGALALEDLGSLNGLYADGARRRTPRLAIGGVTTVRIGRTQLRITPADAPVPPALPDTEAGDRIAALLASQRWSVALIVAGFGATGLWLWLNTFESKAVSVAGGEALGLAIASAVWAGFWALIGRASVQRFSFRPHLAATWLFLAAAFAVGILAGYAEFLFPDGPFAGLALLAALVLAAALLERHLGLATLLSRRRRILIAATATGVVLALVLLAGRIATDEFDSGGTVPMTASVKPFPVTWIPTTGLDPFLNRTDALKKELDALPDRK